MKKIILLVLIFLVSGCYENSGKLVTTCVKNEDINTLYVETTYIIDFKENIINNVEVINYYSDRDKNTISSVKLSLNTQEQFIKNLNRTILIDNENEFKVVYNIKKDDDEVILNKFFISEKRSDLVKTLKEKGFECN